MKQEKRTHRLRKGRIPQIGQYYLLTTATCDRIPIFTRHKAAKIVLSSLHWLDQQGRISLEVAVVMPDHLHFVAELHSGNLSKLMQTLKGYTSREPVAAGKPLPHFLLHSKYIIILDMVPTSRQKLTRLSVKGKCDNINKINRISILGRG